MTPGVCGCAAWLLGGRGEGPGGSVPGGGAPLVTGALVAGALVVTGGELFPGGGGELDVGSLADGDDGGGAELGGGSGGDGVDEGGREVGGPLVRPGLLGPGPALPGADDDGGGGLDVDVDGVDVEGVPGEDVDGVEADGRCVDPDGPDGPDDPADADDPGPGGVDVDADPSDEPPEVCPATLNVTYSPNRSLLPAGGSDAVTRAPSGGSPPPSKATASPSSASCRLACPNVCPASLGTARRSRVSNVVSSAPVVPTGRAMPRSGSWTSTRASCATFRVAGRTATTDAFS